METSFEIALGEIYAAMVAAFEAGDAAVLAAMHTADAALIEPDKDPIRGRAAIEAALGTWFERFAFSAGRWEIWETEVLGDTAWDLTLFELQARGLSDGAIRSERWKQLCLWRRQADGRWRLHRLVFNSHRVPTTG
jgi:uncharacterized protein (TIGR02246 family)